MTWQCSKCGGTQGDHMNCRCPDGENRLVLRDDAVNHPGHYTSHPSGVECIEVTEHMGFCLGNAMKYIWRADEKGKAIEDLEKARWYISREIDRRKGVRKVKV